MVDINLHWMARRQLDIHTYLQVMTTFMRYYPSSDILILKTLVYVSCKYSKLLCTFLGLGSLYKLDL
jgi:hypothetical protein